MEYITIVLIVYLLICGAAASKFGSIAEMKGHEGYFGWCFWLGPIGWAMVIALPDRKKESPDYSELIASMMNQQRASLPAENDDSLPEL